MSPESKALNDLIDAWEALRGGRQVSKRDVERWLQEDMKPAIDAGRAVLGRPLPS